MKKKRQRPIAVWWKTCGRTQRSIATELGLSPAHLCNILSGARKPSLKVALRLSRLSGLTIEDLA